MRPVNLRAVETKFIVNLDHLIDYVIIILRLIIDYWLINWNMHCIALFQAAIEGHSDMCTFILSFMFVHTMILASIDIR